MLHFQRFILQCQQDVEENRRFQRSSCQLPCELVSGWSRKEREVMKLCGKRATMSWPLSQLWGSRYSHTVQLNIVPSVTRCPQVQNSWPKCGDQCNSLSCLRLLIQCANRNWKPLIRKPTSLDLHLGFDWLMSQTPGVGFAVRLLQRWFIIIMISAILECKPWYSKAKVIHLWSVKCQIIFFLKTLIKFGGRHLTKFREQSLVQRQGAAGQHQSSFLVKRYARQTHNSVGDCTFTGGILSVWQLLASGCVLALFEDTGIWLYTVFGNCAVDCLVPTPWLTEGGIGKAALG